MLISNIINDSFGLLSKQLRFYCWHFRRNLDQKQRQELIELLYEQHFERLAIKIKLLTQSCHVADCKQQVGKLLFEHCLTRNRRHQLVQLIGSGLVDNNVRLDNYGRTLLHRCAYNLDVELVKLLINNGVNIRLRDYAGNTALHIAIQSYRNGAVIYGSGPDVVQNLTSIIRLLLEADRDLQQERVKRKRVRLLNHARELEGGNDSSTQATNKQVATCNEANCLADSMSIIDEVALVEHLYPRKACEIKSSKQQQSNQQHLSNKHLDNQKKHDSQFKLNSYISSSSSSSSSFSADNNNKQSDCPSAILKSLLLEDVSSPLVDTKNAFGRTALHYCVLVVGEQHLAHFVQLLISFGADVDATDTRMKTPLYCLVKRPNISEVRQKCRAITYLLESGCDDLGLALEPKTFFNEDLLKNLEQNLSSLLHSDKFEPTHGEEPVFTRNVYQRVPKLKHLTRLKLIKSQAEKSKLRRQTTISLPTSSPASLNLYLNRRILDQSELF